MRRKSYLLAFVVIIAFIGLIITDSSAEYLCGDANSDGAINVSDAVFIINHVFIGGPAPDPYCCEACPLTVTDYDGNVYKVVRIGDQCWTKENLKVTHYRNGDQISHVTLNSSWAGTTKGAYCNYDNDEGNVATYGRLYNWYAVADSRNIAPLGWNVPSDAEWQTLVDYLGGEAVAGGKLKETGVTHWNFPNTGATNTTLFTALPGGYRDWLGVFQNIGNIAGFWSATPASASGSWGRHLSNNSAAIERGNDPMLIGFSVRCMREVNKSATSADYVCGDANGDGLLNVSDAVFIINHVFVGGPAPGPDCCEPVPDCPSTVSDYDGNVYQTVLIGDQCWMMENLKVTHYRNGNAIPHVPGYDVWDDLTTGAYCNYDNDEGNVAIYGRLYNWYAVNDSRGLAPQGWHVPSEEEWQELAFYLGGYLVAGGKMKEAGTAHWYPPNTGATNESGFTGLPAGERIGLGVYWYLGEFASFWSATPHDYFTRAFYLHNDEAGITLGGGTWHGYSVRCVRDQ